MHKIINNKIIITISYEDYIYSLGGTNKVILAQSKILMDRKISSVFISPLRIFGGRIGNDKWILRIDGELIFIGNTNQILAFLGRYVDDSCHILCIQIHHLKNVMLQELDYLIAAFDGIDIFFYIHDMFTICPKETGSLIRNGRVCDIHERQWEFCACCEDYKKIIIKQYRAFFEKHKDQITFIAPSEFCKETWLKMYPSYREKTRVIYHQSLSGKYSGNSKTIDNNAIIKVGFVGKQSVTKGWPVFIHILSKIEHPENYEFYCFGDGKEQIERVRNVNVDFHDGINAMTEALRKRNIDMVFLLSVLPETYSYTYFESFAANAYIITLNKSGNIAYQVKARNNGIVFESEDRIIDYLNSIDIVRTDINAYRDSKLQAPLELDENDEFIDLIDMDGSWKLSYQNTKTNPVASWGIIGLYKFENLIKRLLNKN